MKATFLCPNHRQWLLANTERAERMMLSWLDQGRLHFAAGQRQAARCYGGCAYELADHLLEVQWPDPAVAVRRFSQCASLLLATACDTAERARCQQLITATRNRLRRQWQCLEREDSDAPIRH